MQLRVLVEIREEWVYTKRYGWKVSNNTITTERLQCREVGNQHWMDVPSVEVRTGSGPKPEGFGS